MGILIDFLVIAVMLLCIFIGYKRGLIKVAVKIVAIVLSIVFALIFYMKKLKMWILLMLMIMKKKIMLF